MTATGPRKGANAEREIARILSDLSGWDIERAYGAGRPDDRGDLDGLPDCVAQVRNWKDVNGAVRTALDIVESQKLYADVLYGVAIVRHPGGKWVVSMTPETFIALLREATA